jgi:hypothetical protein
VSRPDVSALEDTDFPGLEPVNTNTEYQETLMANGDVITYYENGQWKSKVAGNDRASHVGGTKAEQQAIGRDMARERKVEHEIRNMDGTIGEKNSYGSDPRGSRG